LIRQDLFLVLYDCLLVPYDPLLITEHQLEAILIAQDLLLIPDDRLLIPERRLRHDGFLGFGVCLIWIPGIYDERLNRRFGGFGRFDGYNGKPDSSFVNDGTTRCHSVVAYFKKGQT
jgi:hypothetical protein